MGNRLTKRKQILINCGGDGRKLLVSKFTKWTEFQTQLVELFHFQVPFTVRYYVEKVNIPIKCQLDWQAFINDPATWLEITLIEPESEMSSFDSTSCSASYSTSIKSEHDYLKEFRDEFQPQLGSIIDAILTIISDQMDYGVTIDWNAARNTLLQMVDQNSCPSLLLPSLSGSTYSLQFITSSKQTSQSSILPTPTKKLRFADQDIFIPIIPH